MHWAHFLAVSAAFVAIAVIMGVSSWAHSDSASRIYTSVQVAHHDGSDPVNAFGAGATDWTVSGTAGYNNSQSLLSLAREGAHWANAAHGEATVWAVVVLIFMFLVMGYHFWQTRF